MGIAWGLLSEAQPRARRSRWGRAGEAACEMLMGACLPSGQWGWEGLAPLERVGSAEASSKFEEKNAKDRTELLRPSLL